MFENKRVIVATTVEGKVLTNMCIHQTTLDLIPVLVIDDIALQPVREISNPVLPIPFARQVLPHLPVGDEQREDGEEDEPEDEQEGDKEVHVECHIDTAHGAYDSEGGYKDDEDAADEKRVLKHLLAVGGGATVDVHVGGGAHGGEAEEQGEYVKGTNYGVAYANHHVRYDEKED